MFDELVARVKRLNITIAEDNSHGESFCIEHSYFRSLSAQNVTDAKLSAIVEHELVPTLWECWFDEFSKVRQWTNAQRGAKK